MTNQKKKKKKREKEMDRHKSQQLKEHISLMKSRDKQMKTDHSSFHKHRKSARQMLAKDKN